MAANAILVLCAQALLIQFAFSQYVNSGAWDGTRYGASLGLGGRGCGCEGSAYNAGWPARGLGFGCTGPIIDITATSGGSLPVTSASAIPPVGVTIASENVYEGTLAAAGELPFIGTVSVESVLPTAGAGAINYGCGNGVTVMVSDNIAAGYGIFDPAIGVYDNAAIASPAYGYGAGWANPGYGCGY